jgi:hypothetical protein
MIQLGTGSDAVEITVRSISGDTLTVDAFRALTDYTVETPVASVESSAKSFLTSPIAGGTLVNTLRVRGFDAGELVILTSTSDVKTSLLLSGVRKNVQRLTFRETDKQAPAACPVDSNLITTDSQLDSVFVEPIAAGATIDAATVVVFQEREKILLGTGTDTVEITVRSISGDTLTVTPFKALHKYLAGTRVSSAERNAISVLTSEIKKDALVNSLRVRAFVAGDTVMFPGPLTLTVARVKSAQRPLVLGQRLRVPEFCLVHSGSHTIVITQE